MNKYTFNSMVVVIITEMSSTQFGLHLRCPSLSPEKKVCHRSATIQEAQKFSSLFLSKATAVPDFPRTHEDPHSEVDPTFSVVFSFFVIE